MRFTWLEAACVVAIAIAALQVQPGERAARLFTPPSVSLPALKGWIVADNKRARDLGNQRIGHDGRGNDRDAAR